MAPVDREFLLPLRKTLALPSSSHLPAPLLFLRRQTAPARKKKKKKIQTDKLEMLSLAAALAF